MMTDHNFEYMMWDLKREIKPSDEATTRLNKLEAGSARTFVGKRIVRMQIAAALLLILMIPTVAFAGYSLSQIVFEKTKDAGISEEQRWEIQQYFEENEYTIEEIKELYPLKRNEKGLTYGLHLYNPDLVMAYAENGEIGYVYQSDLDAIPGSDVKNPSEAMEYMKWKEENDYQHIIKVYKADGETVIGEMVIEY